MAEESIRVQLDEYELLSAMYDESELHQASGDMGVNVAEMRAMISSAGCLPAGYLDEEFEGIEFFLKLASPPVTMEVAFNLPPSYPSNQRPNVFVRSEQLDLTKFNQSLRRYIDSLEYNAPIVMDIIQWIKDNCDGFIRDAAVSHDDEEETMSSKMSLGRFWIHSHHLYSSTKRRNLISLAGNLSLNGFSMPGKPGVIVAEGYLDNCQAFWDTVRNWNWKKIALRESEVAEEGTELYKDFLRLDKFSEIAFSSQSRQGNGREYHMDMGMFRKFLADKRLEHGFTALFGLEAKE
uniref:RWD domain-containing protein n=1 Tax=Plectus sambesii TaxID=2011161 RepID=A0A914W0K3_9BILA